MSNHVCNNGALTALVRFVSTSLGYNQVTNVMKALYIDNILRLTMKNKLVVDDEAERRTEE